MAQSSRSIASSFLSAFVSSNSALAPLISAVRDVVRTSQSSNRQEWLDFGEYVKSMVEILLCELEKNQALRNGALSNDVWVFQCALEDISRKISGINNSPFRRLRYRTLDVERTIETLRRQLSDALSLFQVRTSMELLSRAHPLDTTSRDTVPGLGSGNSTSLPSNAPRRCGRPNMPSQLRRKPVPEPQTSRTYVNTMTAWQSQPCGEAEISLQKVNSSGHTSHSNSGANLTPLANQSGKRLNTPSNNKAHTNSLAGTLYRLSDQMAITGNLGDALTLSQGAAGLYRAQAERQLAVYYRD